jgi:hypothetical protein
VEETAGMQVKEDRWDGIVEQRVKMGVELG